MKLMNLLYGLCLLGWLSAIQASTPTQQAQPEQDHSHHDHRAPLPEGSEGKVSCRSGAFVEATAILNSTMEIAAALPASTPERTQAEINNLLYIAIKQAHDEARCVQGVLRHGYDQSFIAILQRAGALAKARGMRDEVAQWTERAIATIKVADKR
jgi:hypothetical protein